VGFGSWLRQALQAGSAAAPVLNAPQEQDPDQPTPTIRVSLQVNSYPVLVPLRSVHSPSTTTLETVGASDVVTVGCTPERGVLQGKMVAEERMNDESFWSPQPSDTESVPFCSILRSICLELTAFRVLSWRGTL
jgi:hypothetical protein